MIHEIAPLCVGPSKLLNCSKLRSIVFNIDNTSKIEIYSLGIFNGWLDIGVLLYWWLDIGFLQVPPGTTSPARWGSPVRQLL